MSRSEWRRRATLSILCCCIAGCSTLGDKLNPFNWFASTTGIKPAALVEIKSPSVTFNTMWRASTSSAGAFAFTPAVADSAVYAAGSNGDLTALDALNGTQRWRIQASRDGLSAGVGALGDTVVVGTIKGDVLAFDSKGQEKWKAVVSSEILAPPLVTPQGVFVRSNDNRIYAFSAQDGRRLWVYQRTAPALIVRNFGGLSASSETIFGGFAGGRLVALNIANGTVRWEGTVALPKGATELERIADVTSSPVISARDVCAVAYQGRAACFEAANGQPIWAREVSSFMGLTYDARYVFVSDEKSSLVALARATGSSLWKQDQLAYRSLSAPLSLSRAVVVGDFQGILHAVAREEGGIVGRTQSDGSAITAQPISLSMPGKEAFLVQTRNGGLFAFSL